MVLNFVNSIHNGWSRLVFTKMKLESGPGFTRVLQQAYMCGVWANVEFFDQTDHEFLEFSESAGWDASRTINQEHEVSFFRDARIWRLSGGR